jgi:uncharacterized membrane protein YeaQ/YmgE (transglycosylase-associated protein family)
MGVFHILWAIVVGFFAGLLARALMPGTQVMGFWMTVILGIAGSFVGGFVGSLISKPEPGSKFHAAGFVMSIVGAFLLLLVWRLIR